MKHNKPLNNQQTSIDSYQIKYHTVSIRNDLSVIPKYYKEEPLQDVPPYDFWINKLNSQELSSISKRTSDASQRYEIQHWITSDSYTSTCISHPILTAFLYAYNSHEDIILSPDDIWLMICIYFSKYVNENSSKLNHFYIDNEQTKSLTIENEQTIEYDWEDFLGKIHNEMTKHVKKDLCNLLRNDFSTTTKVESLLSSLIVMNTFKKIFDYTYSISSCGIRNIHFMGNLNDWILLYNKTKQLQVFTIENDDFFQYINGILPILHQFIETYQGNVNNQFWDTIFDLKHTKDESNQSDGIYINGWFLRLCYGHHMKQTCSMKYIQLESLIVPVQVENEYTNTLKTSYLVGGFHGILSQNEKHKPVLSMVIIDDVQSITELEDSIDE